MPAFSSARLLSSASADSRTPRCARSPRLQESPSALPTTTLTPRTPLSWPSTSVPRRRWPHRWTRCSRKRKRWRLASAGSSNTNSSISSPNRALLGALSGHVDPTHALSPFSKETAAIREQDIAFFQRAVEDSRVKLPSNIAPYLSRLLWLYQMGLLLFWVYDHSARQTRTQILFDKTLKMILIALRLAGLPFLRPIHRLAGELLDVIYDKSSAKSKREAQR